MITLRGRGKPRFDRNARVGYTRDARGNLVRSRMGRAAKPGEYYQSAPGVFEKYSMYRAPTGSGMKTTFSSGSKRNEIQSPQRPQARLYRPKKDDGIGEAMSFGQKANFIKSKGKGTEIKRFGKGGVYGVRTTV
tara:strand:+ start:218 stop:619 length:402 start_codon:yes stop_codon:yes gene_type:complete